MIVVFSLRGGIGAMNETAGEKSAFNFTSNVISVKSELETLYEFVLQAGGKVISYHLTPPFHSQTSSQSTVFHFGLDAEISKLYLDPSVFENDPIPDYVMEAGYCMTWKQALKGQKLKPDQIAFSKKAQELGFLDGFGAPLHGPNSQDSFFSVNFGREISGQDAEILQSILARAQLAHSRICTFLQQRDRSIVKLSQREREVLYWISRGKSSYDISVILGISTGTVDTYVKRLFFKLDVHDRMSAVIKGLSGSLIHVS